MMKKQLFDLKKYPYQGYSTKPYPIYNQNGQKLAKIDTLVMSKKFRKPYPLRPHISIWPILGSTPGRLQNAHSQLYVSTRFLLFHYCTYLANHQPKLVNGTQGDGSTSFTPPWRRKSIHLYTFPSFRSSGRQDCAISLICEVPSTRSHILTCDNIPWKDWSASKPPPTWSWSCPSVRVPPSLIVWPFIKVVPFCFTTPSLKNFHDPKAFSQERQIWCHAPSLAVTVVAL